MSVRGRFSANGRLKFRLSSALRPFSFSLSLSHTHTQRERERERESKGFFVWQSDPTTLWCSIPEGRAQSDRKTIRSRCCSIGHGYCGCLPNQRILFLRAVPACAPDGRVPLPKADRTATFLLGRISTVFSQRRVTTTTSYKTVAAVLFVRGRSWLQLSVRWHTIPFVPRGSVKTRVLRPRLSRFLGRAHTNSLMN